MPHEVIMPALGMAQDSGLIVAWLKKPGDAVARGEAIMEVETDKATMEVEAQATGFLTDVRAVEGDNVPVGDIVATISDTADAASEEGGAPPAPEAANNVPASQASDAKAVDPDGRQVIMPALGMAQESGKVISWLKSAGDRVETGDALLEVETDKATMEVEADSSGFLAAIYAEEGDDVPVGDVIAVITSEKPDAPVTRKAAPVDKKPQTATSSSSQATPSGMKQSEPATAVPAPAVSPAAVSDRFSGRILASPKARRLARERGLDLGRLAEAGYPQPYHVADLETLAALPQTTVAGTQAQSGMRLEARVPQAGMFAFLDWLATEGDAPSMSGITAAFAASAMRDATGANDIGIRIDRVGKDPATLVDPDLSGNPAVASNAPPRLILRDLSATRITSAALEPSDTPVLTLTRDGQDFYLTLDLSRGTLDADTALGVLSGFADRLESPLRQLL